MPPIRHFPWYRLTEKSCRSISILTVDWSIENTCSHGNLIFTLNSWSGVNTIKGFLSYLIITDFYLLLRILTFLEVKNVKQTLHHSASKVNDNCYASLTMKLLGGWAKKLLIIQAALVIRGFDSSRTQKPRITRENCHF